MPYCSWCGEPILTRREERAHACAADQEADEDFCDECGAELTDHLTCDNDHDDDTERD